MRDYTRKAKRVDNGEWVTGYYVYVDYLDKHYILASFKEHLGVNSFLAMKEYEIEPETICDPTGLTDKKGQKIWENDVCNCIYDGRLAVRVIVWDESELDFKGTNGKENYKTEFDYLGCCEEIEVIGNVFDNADLLKE